MTRSPTRPALYGLTDFNHLAGPFETEGCAHAADPAMGGAAQHREIGAVQRACPYLYQNLFGSG